MAFNRCWEKNLFCVTFFSKYPEVENPVSISQETNSTFYFFFYSEIRLLLEWKTVGRVYHDNSSNEVKKTTIST